MGVPRIRTLLIDADVLAYRSAIEHEVAEEVEDGYWTWGCDINKVKDSARNTINYFRELLDAENHILCLSDDNGNFRKSISQEYKENRVRLRRPVVLKPLRQWMLDELDAVIYPNLEGDDVMGIIATDPSREDERVIVSIDKDMQTVPGLLFFEDKLQEITEDQANYYHLYQTLIGDPIDGYKGCPGVGPVAATKALTEAPTWATVVKLFKKAKLTEEDALKQAQMAKILRYQDWNQEEQKPILWRPE